MSTLILGIVIAGLCAAGWLSRIDKRRALKGVLQSRLESVRREAEQEEAIAELGAMLRQAPSEQRAAAVKSALVAMGISPMQLVAVGYGATRTIARASPARVEIARAQ